MSKRTDERIISFLGSGKKRRKDIIKFVAKAEDVNTRTVERRLSKLKDEGKIKKTESTNRKVWYSLPPKKRSYAPALRIATETEVNNYLSNIEKSIELMKHLSSLRQIRGLEDSEWKEREREIIEEVDFLDEESKQNAIKMPANRRYIILGSACWDFRNLCDEKKGVTSDEDTLKRIFSLLDKMFNNIGHFIGPSTHPSIDPLEHMLSAYHSLVIHAEIGVERSEVLSNALERLGLLEDLCSRFPRFGISSIYIIMEISKKRARKSFLKMVEIEECSVKELVELSLRLYEDNFGKLEDALDRLLSEKEGENKERIKKFRDELHLTISEAGKEVL